MGAQGLISKTVACLFNSLPSKALLVPVLIGLKVWLKISKRFGHRSIVNRGSSAFWLFKVHVTFWGIFV